MRNGKKKEFSVQFSLTCICRVMIKRKFRKHIRKRRENRTSFQKKMQTVQTQMKYVHR